MAKVLLDEFLGVAYSVHRSPIAEFRLQLDGRSMVLPDVFFALFEMAGSWAAAFPSSPLATIDLPDRLSDTQFEMGPIPVLFGSPFYKEDSKTIRIGLDIFGSAFFLLSRVEELVKGREDNHQRFPSIASVAYNNNFLGRPLVDEYVELLWSALKHLWPNLIRKRRQFRRVVSCDVDAPFDMTLRSASGITRRVAGDIVKRGGLGTAIGTFRQVLDVGRRGVSADPNWQFDWMMDICEKNDVHCAFNFLTASRHPLDGPGYWGRAEITQLIRRIHDRGHEIGLHTSYTTFEDAEQTAIEFARLRETCDRIGVAQERWGGRQHYLRWKAGVTWRNWDSAGLDYDSSVAFADSPGFRCGTCHPYPVYDVIERRPLCLIERPLVVMECSVLSGTYQGMDYSSGLEKMQMFKNICKRFNGEFTLLWHNSNLKTEADHEAYELIVSG